ncbi:MAG: hypothetical protein ACR2QC_04415 [Gammaproteobacteria bacterium]
MNKIDVEPTAEVIEKAAVYFRDCARSLDQAAESLRKTTDLSYASDAANSIANIMGSIRLDLLVSRPVRALEQAAVADARANNS